MQPTVITILMYKLQTGEKVRLLDIRLQQFKPLAYLLLVLALLPSSFFTSILSHAATKSEVEEAFYWLRADSDDTFPTYEKVFPYFEQEFGAGQQIKNFLMMPPGYTFGVATYIMGGAFIINKCNVKGARNGVYKLIKSALITNGNLKATPREKEKASQDFDRFYRWLEKYNPWTKLSKKQVRLQLVKAYFFRALSSKEYYQPDDYIYMVSGDYPLGDDDYSDYFDCSKPYVLTPSTYRYIVKALFGDGGSLTDLSKIRDELLSEAKYFSRFGQEHAIYNRLNLKKVARQITMKESALNASEAAKLRKEQNRIDL